MTETRKIAAILVADVVGYSRLAGADEDRTLARLRGLRSDLIDPAIDAHHGRIVKRTGDGSLIEFRSVVDAVRCAIEVQQGLIERNAGLPPERRIEFRVGIHLGDVVEEADGDLMGDGVNIAARLEGIAKPGAICLSEDAYRQVSGRLDMEVTDLGPTKLKNIEKPIRAYSLEVGKPALAKPAKPGAPPALDRRAARRGRRRADRDRGRRLAFPRRQSATRAHRRPRGRTTFHRRAALHKSLGRSEPGLSWRRYDRKADHRACRAARQFRRLPQDGLLLRGKNDGRKADRQGARRALCAGRPVQRDQNRVRVDAQLIDAGSGAHLWADQFEADVADLFKLQDEVVARLPKSLGYELVKTEAEKDARSKNPDAVDLAMRGWALVWQEQQQQRTRENNNAAKALIRTGAARSTRTKPMRWQATLTLIVLEYTRGWATSGTDYEAKILGQADRVIALAP